MLTILRKIIAVIISFFVFLPISVTPWYSFDENAEMTAIVISDTHFEGNSTDHWNNNGYGFANAFASTEKADAVCILGDQTMNSQDIEWLFFYGFLSRYDVLDRTIMAFGNHDFGNTDSAEVYDETSARAFSYYNSFCGKSIDKPYYSATVNGYKFIVLGSDKNMENTVQYIGEEQLEWFRNELATAGGDTVFVLNHNLIYGTTGWQSRYSFNQIEGGDEIRAAMEAYSGNVVYLCGHSHYGVYEGSVATIGNVTYCNLPSFGNGGNYDAVNSAGEDSGCGLTIEAFEDYIRLSFVNFTEHTAVEGFDNIIIYK